ncbi:F1F0 ATP synthase assembly protein Atp10 [Crepidotus variabilis]|uniref:F1F0 ATP synthase assembly protein Atp10 n=1 Tax=Crepidotus variabilis TaxID=179855 RepID=A0A9P6JRV7_9AGAR|nr:F1F0 ATP synthase assembly protein Atp10 [Crepidotus variabilis]
MSSLLAFRRLPWTRTCLERSFGTTRNVLSSTVATKKIESTTASQVETTLSKRHVSSSEDTSSQTPNSSDTQGAPGLPPLNRPLGIKQRPTTVERTRKEKLKDLLDQDARMAQRRHLVNEASKGYFHDMNMTRRNGGKTWIAPRVLIKEEKALYLPNIHGKSLVGGERKNTTDLMPGKVSLLGMLGTRVSEAHVQSFTATTYARYSSNPFFQFIHINLQENLLKAFLVKLFSNSLRSTVPSHFQEHYLISNQNMEYLRDPMGMTNSKVGYVYLIDENLKIRWAGCADATEREAQSLESCTGVLLKRLEENSVKKSKSKSPQ